MLSRFRVGRFLFSNKIPQPSATSATQFGGEVCARVCGGTVITTIDPALAVRFTDVFSLVRRAGQTCSFDRPHTSTTLVYRCRFVLKDLSDKCCSRICWIPGHQGLKQQLIWHYWAKTLPWTWPSAWSAFLYGR